MSREDELARTATAAASASGPCATPLGATLGRYRLERELGSGGMGVVHAAFDPDLERRVALKVLRNAAAGDEGRQRLLREARAMARLAHPNVVGVHEVGSEGGRDYVAMELVDGGTVDDWLRAETRTPAEIFAVFDAAGHGLAAAHAAGLVHRDFKPHNVLRGRDGRVVVTDFGLARGVDSAPDPMAATQEMPATASSSSPSASSASALSALTRTGSVLGTPAYMAPEQWRGEVGPATDQFAFCVALWEALARQRPFRADSAIALRALVERGPAREELAKLPRRVRAALRRGLDPDPARRWPTMDALLAALRRGERRRRVLAQTAVLTALAALIFVVIAVLTYHADPVVVPAAFACPPPLLEPASVWPAGEVAKLTAAGQKPAAGQLAADLTRWTAAHDAACQLGDAGRDRRACLDGVLGRFDAIARGVEGLGSGAFADAGELLVDPAVCALAQAPRLTPPTAQMREVLARWLALHATQGPPDVAALHALVERAAPDPCALALAERLDAEAEESTAARTSYDDRAAADAERCTDERVRADIALAQAESAVESELLDVSVRAKMQHAETAVMRVAQPDLIAGLDLVRAGFSRANDALDGSITHLDAAAAGFAVRDRVAAQASAAYAAILQRMERGKSDDLAAQLDRVIAWRTLAAGSLGDTHPGVLRLDRAIALEHFASGEVEASHHALDELRRELPQRHPRRITGHVVDANGQPVAHARVTAGPTLRGDGISAVMAWPQGAAQRVTTTDAAGAFAIEDAPRDGGVVAEAGELRAWSVAIADDVRIVVAPPTHMTGHVELHGAASRNVVVAIREARRAPAHGQAGLRDAQPAHDDGAFRDYMVLAPVDRDGAFDISNVPRGDVELTAIALNAHGVVTANARAKLDKPHVDGVQLAIPATSRMVDVVVRSTVSGGPGNAEVILIAGKPPATLTATEVTQHLGVQTLRYAHAIDGEHAPPAVLAVARPGDLIVTLANVPAGDVSACAIALPNDVDPDLQRKIDHSYDKLTFRCAPIAPGAAVATVEIPPWPRLD